MTTLSLRLPASIHRRLAEVAEREGVSINQLISSAVAEKKMSALMTEEYLEIRAQRGSRARFLAGLAKVPDLDPEPADRRVVRPQRRAVRQRVAADVPERRSRHRRVRG